MVHREHDSDRVDKLRLASRERWTEFEDAGIELTDRVWTAVQEGWAWAQQRPLVLRWATVIISVAVSLIVGASFHRNVTLSSQLLFLLPAVLVSGLYGGLYAGTVASLVGAVAAILFKLTPTPAALAPDIVGLFLYAISCSMILVLCHAQQTQQRQIMDFTGTLEERVKERTGELETANRELLDLCYSISHDLRAPMRNIVGSSRILLDESGNVLTTEAKTTLQGIANSANKLASWVDDLLRYAKLGHTELRPEWVNVTQIVDEITSQMGVDGWPFSSVAVHVQPNLVTTGDRVLVGMALRNIFENAYKYAKGGQPLIIEVGERMVKGRTFLTVRDNGIGFEQQYSEKIFEPFQRLHRETEYPGSGIGLANVKRIVERHGGQVFAEGVPMIGAAFFLRFGSGKTEGQAIYADAR